jgi:hypothetical protein
MVSEFMMIKSIPSIREWMIFPIIRYEIEVKSLEETATNHAPFPTRYMWAKVVYDPVAAHYPRLVTEEGQAVEVKGRHVCESDAKRQPVQQHTVYLKRRTWGDAKRYIYLFTYLSPSWFTHLHKHCHTAHFWLQQSPIPDFSVDGWHHRQMAYIPTDCEDDFVRINREL